MLKAPSDVPRQGFELASVLCPTNPTGTSDHTLFNSHLDVYRTLLTYVRTHIHCTYILYIHIHTHTRTLSHTHCTYVRVITQIQAHYCVTLYGVHEVKHKYTLAIAYIVHTYTWHNRRCCNIMLYNTCTWRVGTFGCTRYGCGYLVNLAHTFISGA